MSRARRISRWASTVIALLGWVGAAVVWYIFGVEAGIRPSFIFALSLGIAFTMIASQCWALPHRAAREEQASIFALGFAEGVACASCPHKPTPDSGQPQSRLEVVR